MILDTIYKAVGHMKSNSQIVKLAKEITEAYYAIEKNWTKEQSLRYYDSYLKNLPMNNGKKLKDYEKTQQYNMHWLYGETYIPKIRRYVPYEDKVHSLYTEFYGRPVLKIFHKQKKKWK